MRGKRSNLPPRFRLGIIMQNALWIQKMITVAMETYSAHSTVDVCSPIHLSQWCNEHCLSGTLTVGLSSCPAPQRQQSLWCIPLPFGFYPFAWKSSLSQRDPTSLPFTVWIVRSPVRLSRNNMLAAISVYQEHPGQLPRLFSELRGALLKIINTCCWSCHSSGFNSLP